MTKFWVGKLLGAVAGTFSGGLAGLVIGTYAGHLIDKLLANRVNQESSFSGQDNTFSQIPNRNNQRDGVQDIFFEVLFRTMGKIAKSDGRVSEHEIGAASKIMQRMSLTGQQRQRAIGFFNEGKSNDYSPTNDWARFKKHCGKRDDLLQIFVEIQLSIAYADGHLSSSEQRLFKQLCYQLDIDAFRYEWIHNRVRSSIQGHERHQSQQSSRQERGHRGQGRQSSAYSVRKNEIQRAYGILGVKPEVSDAELKKTYRKLMSEHHPDKLVSRGLPESMMELAKEKTQEIQQAYDVVVKHRQA